MSLAGAKIFENSGSEGVGQTTVSKADVDTDRGSSPPPHVHVHFDLAHKACLAEIASLFEDIQADLRVITDRGDNRAKGIYVRKADTVAPNPANIAEAARDYINLEQSGLADLIDAEVGNPTDLGNTNPINYNAIRNAATNPGGFQGGTASNEQSAAYGGGTSTAIAGTDGKTYYEGSVPLDKVTPTNGTGKGNVSYALGKIRNLPIQKQLWDILETAAKSAGVDVEITSGGQVPVNEGGVSGVNRTGSNRHDKGYAADIRLFTGTGAGKTRLYTTNQEQLAIMLKFVEACKAGGATGIGMGNGYMNNGNIHVDIAWLGQKAGVISGILSSRYWGGTPTNTASAPTYLADVMATRDNTA